VRLLDWEDAHTGSILRLPFSRSICAGVQPPGLPYSTWELVEHVRRAQADILDFCRNPSYRALN